MAQEASGAAEQQPAQQLLVAKVQRFAANLGLAFVDLGILPEPHDTDVPPDLFPLQVSLVLPTTVSQQPLPKICEQQTMHMPPQ